MSLILSSLPHLNRLVYKNLSEIKFQLRRKLLICMNCLLKVNWNCFYLENSVFNNNNTTQHLGNVKFNLDTTSNVLGNITNLDKSTIK